ncbi:hypothetical protein HHX47_DHR1001904 [Lentinula edodes]|nr:hypothetical protein HHX47_DHR1001904 [Lentinula edodes]
MTKQVLRQTNFSQTPPVHIFISLLARKLSEDDLRKEILASPFLTENILDDTKARQLAEMIALTPDFRLAVEVLQLAHVLGCPLKQNAYECTAHHLSTKLRWAAVLSVVSLGIRHTRTTTVRLLNWRIRALVETYQHASLRSILEEFERFRVKPTRRTFHLLISGHIRNRDLLGARKLLRLMDQIGFPPDNSTHAVIAANYRNLGPNAQVQDQALQSLMFLEENTAVTVLNRLIQLRLDAQDPAATLRMLTVFDPKQVSPIIKVVSDAVSTPGGGNPSAEPLEEIYREYYLSANADTFATFLHYMALRQDFPGALLILEGLVRANIPPTPDIFTALIHVYFSTGHNSAAFRTVLDICHVRPSEAFTSLLRQGLYDPVAYLPFVPTNIIPTPRMFNALLKGSISTHGFACVRDIFTIMQANNIRPNESTVEVLIASAGKSQNLRPRTLLRLLNIPDLEPTLRHIHVLLSCIIRHERYQTFGVGWNVTAALFSRTRQAKRRIRSEGALMEGYTRKGDLPAALDVLKAATRVGIKPNCVMYTILIVGYARQGQPEQAVTTFKQMIEADIRPDVASIDAVVGAFFAVGAYSMARRSLRTLWSYVQPFPNELESASLKELATQFRLLHKNDQGVTNSEFTQSHWKRLYRQLRQLIAAWKTFDSSERFCYKIDKK